MKKIEIEAIKSIKIILNDLHDVVTTHGDNDVLSINEVNVFEKYIHKAETWVEALLEDKHK